VGNWQQVQTRIRKAKTSADPTGQLAALYSRTRDAMAAYELAVVQERGGNREQAVEWYTVAVQRFRRQEWKKKAEDALVRLGAPVPVTSDLAAASEPGAKESSEPASLGDAGAAEPPAEDFKLTAQKSEPTLFGSGDFAQHEEPADTAPVTDAQAAKAAEAAGPAGLRRKRRRGRRGGRGRRRKPGATATATGAAATPAPIAAATARTPATPAASAEQSHEEEASPRAAPFAIPPPRREAPVSFLRDPDSAPSATSFLQRGRPGDPALSSRLAPLESQLRRLLAATPSPVEEAPGAPAGPGVFLLSDSDQTTYYYIESCQTLRIGIANLLRTASRGRGPAVQGDPVRTRLAEHLGITAAKAPKYLKDYCVVRWLQLDEGAPHLAHFAIAILKPALND
jgi:hypothetical protein